MFTTTAIRVVPFWDRLIVGGELDPLQRARFQVHLDAWLGQKPPSYTLDLRPTRLIDSSALGLVVGASPPRRHPGESPGVVRGDRHRAGAPRHPPHRAGPRIPRQTGLGIGC